MNQISPPIRILLVAVIGVVAVYMLFLRPKAEVTPPVAAAPVTATPVPAKDVGAKTNSKAGAIVQKAIADTTDASAKSKVAAGEQPGGLAADTTTGTATTPAAGTTVAATPVVATSPVTKETLAQLPKDIRRPVAKHKVLVLLFYNNRSADDRAVRRALSHVKTYGGQVFVAPHWIKTVARYQAITRGVDVEQSPTIVVADRNLKAETLVGYADEDTINQTVVDAIRASGGTLITDPYLRKLNAVCVSSARQVDALPRPATDAAVAGYFAAAAGISDVAFKKELALKPPAKHARLHKQLIAWEARRGILFDAAATEVKQNPKQAVATVRKVAVKTTARNKAFVADHGRHGLSCF